MTPRFAILLAGGLAPLIGACPAVAQVGNEDERLAVGIAAGTRGAALDFQYSWSDHVVLRGSADLLSWQIDGHYKRADYAIETRARAVGAFIDLHPLGDGFLISGGIYLGQPDIDLEARPTGILRIGGVAVTPAQVGRLDGRITVNDAAPFVGVGFDNTFQREARWGFRAIAGASFTGTPRVSLSSHDGTLSNSRAFQTRLAAEARDFEDELSSYTLYPVVQLGVSYRF